MAITPVNTTITVTTAGTRVACTASTGIKPSSVYIEALSSNTGYIYVGLVTVSSTVFMTRLSAGEGFSLNSPAPEGRDGGTGLQLSSIYLDSSVSGEKAQLTYVYSQG